MPSSNELRFCPLFSGSSGNALYVGYESTHLLIDVGMSGAKITSELSRIGLSPDLLSGILITHEHTDHIAGAGILSRKYDLPIFANERTWEAMKPKLGNIQAKNIRVFETGIDFPIDSLDITPFAIPHDAAEPVGFSICTQDLKLCIATDLGTVKESWMKHLENSDLVLLESNHDVDMLKASRYPYDLKRRILGTKGHLSNDTAGKAAAALVQRGVRAIVLGHLSGDTNFPELAYQSVCCMLQQAGIEPGRDVMLSVASRDGSNATYILRGDSDMKTI